MPNPHSQKQIESDEIDKTHCQKQIVSDETDKTDKTHCLNWNLKSE